MLNFFTTSNGFRSTLPVVSNLTAMNVWDGVCMCCIYASLLEFVLVNYVGRKRSDWPLPIVYQNKDQDYKQITQVKSITNYFISNVIFTILFMHIYNTYEPHIYNAILYVRKF